MGGTAQPPFPAPLGPAGAPPAIHPPPFDPYLVEKFFPRSPEGDDTTLSQLLLNRHSAISPTAGEQAAISALVSNVKKVLDNIVVAPDLFTAVGIEEVHEVGSYKKGTMLAGSNTADVVVILKTLPTMESVNALGQKLVTDLVQEHKEGFNHVPRDYGCDIEGPGPAIVRLLITILPQNAHLLEPDLHLSADIMRANMAAIRHARWFDAEVKHSTVKVLIRLMKDIRKRFDGFKAMNVWVIEVLSQYCVFGPAGRTGSAVNRNQLPLSHAFKRFFQVLSAGILLPNSGAIFDPCEGDVRNPNKPPVLLQAQLTYEDMDSVCSTAQTLLRVILHGGTEQVLGIVDKGGLVATDISVFGNVVVTPLEKAYAPEEMEAYQSEAVAEDSGNGVPVTA
ncbi:DZF family protein [Aphelenchoides avenae]|nr:DZF family protein [Aphelenchus avenae]KAH7730531.1 DZF family protein [Aphelenchus avenae]